MQTVKTQLENHETRRNHRAQGISEAESKIPTLFNVAVNKLANSIGQDAEEDLKSLEAMEGLPPNVLSRLALKLENIPYDMFCRARQLADDDEGEVDEWLVSSR